MLRRWALQAGAALAVLLAVPVPPVGGATASAPVGPAEQTLMCGSSTFGPGECDAGVAEVQAPCCRVGFFLSDAFSGTVSATVESDRASYTLTCHVLYYFENAPLIVSPVRASCTSATQGTFAAGDSARLTGRAEGPVVGWWYAVWNP